MKYFIKVPVPKLHGPYLAHKAVYEAAGGVRPVWRRYSDHALVLADQASPTFPCKEYDPAPHQGQRVRAELLCELSRAEGKPTNGGRSPRVDPVLQAWIASEKMASWAQLGLEHGTAWLEKKQSSNGFEIEQIDVADYSTIEFVRDGKPIRIGTVSFSAIVNVVDAQKFRAAMLNGVGHGKAWGLGLLLCKRVHS